MNKSYKFRMYPTKQQKVLLSKHFGCKRWIYNYGLELTNKHYKETKKHLSWIQVANTIPQLKKKEETCWLKEVNSQSLQSAIKNLDAAFTNFFKKQGRFPKFKSKKDKQSFQVPQGYKIDIEKSIIILPKIKKGIKTVFHRKIEGETGVLTISKNSSDQYFVSILTDDGKELPKKSKPNKKKAIGIDLGIKDFAILSNGEKIENPNIAKDKEKRLAKLQRNSARKILKSKNRNKANIKVAKLYQHITNKKLDFLQKLSTKLIRENQTICLEDLNVAGMVKNHCLSKAIQRCSWSEFVRQLKYKADWYGKNIIQINRFSPSSKMCNICGKIKEDLTLKDREWVCLGCGTKHDRDINAAKNILDFAFHPKNRTGQELPVEPTEKLTSVSSHKRIKKSVQ
jgi:putative transposase